MLTLDEAESLGAAAREAAQITRDNTKSWWNEEDITEEFINNLSNNLNSASLHHLVSTEEFSKHSPKAESAVGADFLFVVVYATEAAITKWGFLSQAKYYANAVNQSNAKSRLVKQCQIMQEHTPASFSNIYYNNTYRFISASQIAADGLSDNNLSLREMSKKFSNRGTQKFFKEVFYGLWGDPWVAQHADQLLEADSVDEVPNRGVAVDGGEPPFVRRGMVTIIKEKEANYSVSDRLNYETIDIFSNTDI